MAGGQDRSGPPFVGSPSLFSWSTPILALLVYSFLRIHPKPGSAFRGHGFIIIKDDVDMSKPCVLKTAEQA